MTKKEDSRLEIIERLVDHVIDNLPKEESPLIKNFIRQYYLSISPEDLSSKSIEDLYAAVISHWHFILQRYPGEIKVRVFNPSLEQHGWQTMHSVIEIGCDDMPFLVDSVLIELNQLEVNIHLIIHMGNIKLRRNTGGHIIEVADYKQSTHSSEWLTEAAIYIEIDRQSDKDVLETISKNLYKVLNDVKISVEDWPRMKQQMLNILEYLESNPPPLEKDAFQESLMFIDWVADNHFTFMGYQAYTAKTSDEEGLEFHLQRDSSLGLRQYEKERLIYKLSDFTPEAQALLQSEEILILGKTDKRSTVHRPAYRDFIVIKIIDAEGKVIGAHLFDGLYTNEAYNNSAQYIPYLRRKIAIVLKATGFTPKSHDDRAMLNILETLPRDDLFQATPEELLSLCTGILHLQERQKVSLFIRREAFGNFYSCLVFMPRDSYNSDLRERMQKILMEALQGAQVEFSTRLSESILARILFVIRVDPRQRVELDLKMLEQALVETARTWKEGLRTALYEHAGEERGNELFKRYGSAFPASYCENFSSRTAVVDIDYFESLSDKKSLMMSLYRPLEETEDVIRFKLFRIGATIPLSDVVPILENMGLRIINERPYEIAFKDNVSIGGSPSIWINDYRMILPKGEVFEAEDVREIFQEAFDNTWKNEAENDGFNRLVLTAKLNWREIMILRAYAKYLWQTGFTFSQDYIEETTAANFMVTAELVKLFKLRFDSEYRAPEAEILAQKQKIEDALDKITNLNEDRILRQYLNVIMATLRTNYYQKGKAYSYKQYFSFKIESAKVPELPLPLPLYEIFVYSPRMEGIHLRASKVARGGIRYSDRREDFRTEILGLMKAQQVKNSVIVPMGAKGGFVVKGAQDGVTREEVISCYETLICGMLDLTDNLKGNEVQAPSEMIRYDGNDPYLVVAADKGTAAFSDIANEISKDYSFWLGDAFASGGSTGYDHKKMGITAKGAWESVKRHFQELNMDPEKDDFTVIGIGDMSGDVFGNGMLLSKHIKLVAAFNHMHIFLDPNPDPEISFKERERLFNLPRSTWADYQSNLISNGGGVFSRSAKYIILSKEIQERLDFYRDRVMPNELIRAILKAPVDLFWNGGIGTYVKSSTENNANVGDRTNDAVRVNGIDLRTKVVAEGGNLGFTQLGRIEFALAGGHINTDAIDNSGGVNCSDNEVNIKILLNDVVENGDLTEKQRNELLSSMQEEVAELVLYNNRRQNEAISLTVSQAVENLEMHSRLIQDLERTVNLDRALEFLPDKEQVALRKSKGQGLTRPEIAVIMAYVKIYVKKSLLSSDVLEDPMIVEELPRSFPKPLRERFRAAMNRHRLKREIIATRLSNEVINEMGISFINRLQDETGSEPYDIIRAYLISRVVFQAQILHSGINGLAGIVDAGVQFKMLQEVNRLIRRGTRWFLRNRRSGLNIEDNIQYFAEGVRQVSDILPSLISGYDYELEERAQYLIKENVPKELAYFIAGMSAMFSSLDIVEAANAENYPVIQMAAIYYAIGNKLELGWFRELIKRHAINNHWEALARATFRDDLDRQQRNLTISILHMNGTPNKDVETLIGTWSKRHKQLIERWKFFIAELKNTPEPSFTMFSVALRELFDMSQVTIYKKKNHNHATSPK